ncbi:hypothetical protein LguiA_002413 [Lonicera macranthoides]
MLDGFFIHKFVNLLKRGNILGLDSILSKALISSTHRPYEIHLRNPTSCASLLNIAEAMKSVLTDSAIIAE